MGMPIKNVNASIAQWHLLKFLKWDVHHEAMKMAYISQFWKILEQPPELWLLQQNLRQSTLDQVSLNGLEKSWKSLFGHTMILHGFCIEYLQTTWIWAFFIDFKLSISCGSVCHLKINWVSTCFMLFKFLMK